MNVYFKNNQFYKLTILFVGDQDFLCEFNSEIGRQLWSCPLSTRNCALLRLYPSSASWPWTVPPPHPLPLSPRTPASPSAPRAARHLVCTTSLWTPFLSPPFALRQTR